MDGLRRSEPSDRSFGFGFRALLSLLAIQAVADVKLAEDGGGSGLASGSGFVTLDEAASFLDTSIETLRANSVLFLNGDESRGSRKPSDRGVGLSEIGLRVVGGLGEAKFSEVALSSLSPAFE